MSVETDVATATAPHAEPLPNEVGKLTAPGAIVLHSAHVRHIVFLVLLAIAVALSAFTKNFVVFQLTQTMVYAMAIVGLNLLTGFTVSSRWAIPLSTRLAPIRRRS